MTIPNPRKRKRRNPHVIVLQRRNITRKSIVIIHRPPPHLLRIRLPYMLKRRKNPRLQIRKNTTIEDENIELSLSVFCTIYFEKTNFNSFFFQMRTISFLYRFIIEVVFCLVNLSQWVHRMIRQFISRHRYTITVNIDVSRNDPRNERMVSSSSTAAASNEKIQFNKPTEVVAIIINEQIADDDLCKFLVNAILFFRTLNIQHLIIYDYQGERQRERRKENLRLFSCLGYVKARETAIMDYVHAYAKTSRMI